MKKIYTYLMIFAALLSFSSCNDEWEDELYVKMVSFKAPVDSEGVSKIYVRYREDGKGSYNLPVLISGSKMNDEDLNVNIAVDQDTLGLLNEAKFLTRKDLFYCQLPEKFFSFENSVCHLPANSYIADFPINFDFTGLDLKEKWVLPLKIMDDPSYKVNRRKGWGKALLHIQLFNDYSGSYSATNMKISFEDDMNNTMTTGTRYCSVHDKNAVFFYAGTVDDKDKNRGVYKVYVEFLEGITDEKGVTRGNLKVWGEGGINLKTSGNQTYEISTVMDATLPYLEHRYVMLNMNYSYDDITSIKDQKLRYVARGSMTMERKINKLIPDEDQAIQW